MRVPVVTPRPVSGGEVMLLQRVVLARLHWTVSELKGGFSFDDGAARMRYREELSSERVSLESAFRWMLPATDRVRSGMEVAELDAGFLAELLGYCQARVQEAVEKLKATPRERWRLVDEYEADLEVFRQLPRDFSQALSQGDLSGIEKLKDFDSDEAYSIFCEALLGQVVG